jgi:hypothetical protein
MPTKKLTGDLAQTSVGTTPTTITASTTSGSAVLGSPSSTTGLVAGAPLSGAGVPANTTVLSNSGGVVTMSANATATASGVTITVGSGEVQVIGLMEWTIDFKLKTADATTTDDAAWESSLPSSASWTATAKYVYLMGDTSQSTYVRGTIGLAQRTPAKWNFFADPASGDDAHTGLAYIDGIKFAAGVGKIVGMDVTLKGTGPLTIVAQTTPVPNAATIENLQAED